MVFGKKRTHEQQDSVDDEEHVSETQFPHTPSKTQPQSSSQQKDESKPLLDEVTFVGAENSKNAGGAKVWVCKHCKLQFTSSYSIIL